MSSRSISTEARATADALARQGARSTDARGRGAHPPRVAAAALRALVVLVLILAAPEPADAIDLEKIVMPGPLASAHAEYESDCSNCHEAFKLEHQRVLCLDCHEEVAADVQKGEGFHGRHPLASVGACRSCHPDHRGREADILGLSVATFDHAQTDYPLVGAHASAPCGSCHAADAARRDAPSDCFACHEDDDAHGGALSRDCGKCHDEVSWAKSGSFDHDATDFPLTGHHVDAPCIGCHVGGRYADTPKRCVACHSIDDAHAGRFGDDCGGCHQTSGWSKKEFDHERESGGFALIGAHGRAACITCHRQPPGERELPEDCASCHAAEDVHGGRFGTSCADCHSPLGWSRESFDHGERTGFRLRGAHASLACESCHSGPMRDAPEDASCATCHGKDDVHDGSLGTSCATCHVEDSFETRVAFDHELTRFPLLGLHAMVTCERCHEGHTYQEKSLACIACHARDDVHKKTLGDDCSSCHTPNGWAIWRFDHDVRTNFELHGAHEDLECGACHTKAVVTGFQMAQDCIGCHSADDAHRGGFGRSCDDCHDFDAWKPARIGRRRGGSR